MVQEWQRSKGEKEYFHAMLGTTMVAPGHNEVIPLERSLARRSSLPTRKCFYGLIATSERCRREGANMRYVLIQLGIGAEYEQMLSATRAIHEAYCGFHQIDYLVASGKPAGGKAIVWRKVELLLEAMQNGYDSAAWLDADCVIVNPEVNIFDASRFGIAVCECFDSPTIVRHLNLGVMLASRSDEVIDFITLWNSMPSSPGWEEQNRFNELMATRPHRDLLTILPNRFNCLEKHMEARDPVIRAFHGDYLHRLRKIQDLAASSIGKLRL